MQTVSDLMDSHSVLCTTDMRVSEVKHLLKKYSYEEILVVDSLDLKNPVGLLSLADMELEEIQEADIPSDVSALECMRKIPAVILNTSTIDECINIMRDSHLDRIPVVDMNGHFEGMIERDNIKNFVF